MLEAHWAQLSSGSIRSENRRKEESRTGEPGEDSQGSGDTVAAPTLGTGNSGETKRKSRRRVRLGKSKGRDGLNVFHRVRRF
jgi:hypothetical protein